MRSILNFLLGSKSGEKPNVAVSVGPAPVLVEKKEEIKKEESGLGSWDKIIKILNVWETGDPSGKPSLISIFNDGSGGRRQLTLGVGFTEDGGNLKTVIKRYISKGGKFADFFKKYVDGIGNTKKPSLVNDAEFITTLKKASKEDILMIEAQREIFEEVYLVGAKKFVKENGFVLPISWLVFADSTLHSGQPAPSGLRNKFSEVPPSKGGAELAYIRAYLKTRRAWLKSKGGILAKTTYRVDNMISHLEKKDYYLLQPFYANGILIN